MRKIIYIAFIILSIVFCEFGYVDRVYAAEEYWEELPTEPLGYRENKPESVPDEIWEAAVISGITYNIEPELLCAIAYRESRFQNVKSPNGKYYGVMQIGIGSHKKRMDRVGVTDLMVVSQNIQVGADYLAELIAEHGDEAIALMYYHGEPQSNIKRYINKGKMSSYASNILTLKDQYKEETT